MPSLRPACVAEIPALVDFVASELPGLQASAESVERVQQANPRSILVIEEGGHLKGVIALLLLNAAGLKELMEGRFRFADPEPAHIAGPNDVLAGIYVWILCARGRAAAALGHLMQWAQDEGRTAAHIYARTTTSEGERFTRHCGFRPYPCEQQGLWRYERLDTNKLDDIHAA